jgi:hypothetical protein
MVCQVFCRVLSVFQPWPRTLLILLLLASSVHAQPPRFSFTDGRPGWVDVETLLQNASVVKELKADPRRVARARQAILAALEWYTPEIQKVFRLPKEQQRDKQLELLDRYQQNQYEALGRVLKSEQLRRLKEIQVRVAGIDAFAQPWVQTALGVTGEQKSKIEARAKEFAQARAQILADLEQTLKEVLEPPQIRQLKQILDLGAGFDAVGEPWAQKALRLSAKQKTKLMLIAPDLAEASKKDVLLVEETLKKATAALTTEQRQIWEKVAGKPFQLKVRLPSPPPVGLGN